MSGWELLAMLVAGLAVGVLGAMMGIGGGIILVPFLSVAMGIPIHNAIAASLVAVAATSCAGAAIYLARGLANLRLGVVLETATTLGGLVGGLTAISLGRQLLMVLFASALLAVAALAWRRREWEDEELPVEEARAEGDLGSRFYDPRLRRTVRYRVRRLPFGLAVSLGAGFLSGLLGIGGGVVKVPAMVLWMGVPVKAATATSNFMIGITAVASAYVYYGSGLVNVFVTAPVAVGVFLGSVAGALRAPHLRSGTLRRMLAILLGAVALLMGTRAVGLS